LGLIDSSEKGGFNPWGMLSPTLPQSRHSELREESLYPPVFPSHSHNRCHFDRTLSKAEGAAEKPLYCSPPPLPNPVILSEGSQPHANRSRRPCQPSYPFQPQPTLSFRRNLHLPKPAIPLPNTPTRKSILSIAEWISTKPPNPLKKERGADLNPHPSFSAYPHKRCHLDRPLSESALR